MRIFAAILVLALGFALASLFPKRDAPTASAPSPGDRVALRRTALGEDERLVRRATDRALPGTDRTPASSTSGSESAQFRDSDFLERQQRRQEAMDSPALRYPPTLPAQYAALHDQERSLPPRESAQGRTTRPQPTTDRHQHGPAQRITHRIADGDTLDGIASRYLGDASYAGHIWQANREKLPEDPQILPLGVELTIPAGAQLESATLAQADPRSGSETRLVPVAPAQVMAADLPSR